MVFVLKWPPFALAPFAQGVAVENLYRISPLSDLLIKVMTRQQRQYNVPHNIMYHTKQWIFQKNSQKLILRFIQIYKLISISSLQ